MANSPSDDFETLAALVRAGDDSALSELIRRYETKVRTVARSLLGPVLRRHVDSIDVAQSVNLVLVNGLRENRIAIDSEAALISLLITLVRRKVARQWRRVRREETGCSARPSGSADRGPETAAQLNDGLDHIWPTLSEVERRLVELRMLGYSTSEASVEIGVPANSLRVSLSRLRARLRAEGLLDDWF